MLLRKRQGTTLITVTLILMLTGWRICFALPAFPGAEGFGAETTGGRFGSVIEVTNLNDSGPGSLREAVSATGPRTVVFRTGGTITLQTGLLVTDPFLTVAGQTAPGGGITIVTDPAFNGQAFHVATHDVVIRFIRIRVGAASGDLGCCGDSLVLYNVTDPVYNIVVDHCSFSWATDENGETWYGAHDITFQWNVYSEGLADLIFDTNGKVIKNGSRGLIVGDVNAARITVHHNLFAHNTQRNPLIANSGVNHIYNNVIYNWRSMGIELQSRVATGMKINLIGNTIKRGVDSSTLRYPVAVGASLDGLGIEYPQIDNTLYVSDNIDIGPSIPDTDTSINEWAIMGDARASASPWLQVPAPQSWQRVTPWPDSPIPVTLQPVAQAYDLVLANVGAKIPMRDPVDDRIIQDVINVSGQIINDPSEIGGWPVIAAGIAPADSDRDGMPDLWERANGFNPLDATDANGDQNGNGYSNLEDYLDILATGLKIEANGDINNDGAVNTADIILAMRILMDALSPTPDQLLRADVAPLVSGAPVPDGQVTVGDYVVLVQKVFGVVSF